MYAIWNLTDACPWNCALCCMSSKRRKDRKELTSQEKLKVLKDLVKNNIKIDFSGGDPLFYKDDFKIVERALDLLEKENINVSITGCNFTDAKLKLLKRVGKVEVSIDNIPGEKNPFRPDGFNLSAISLLKKLVENSIFCSAVTTLYPDTIGKDRLRNLYQFLCDKGIPKWNILQFYPVGRGFNFPELILNENQLIDIMDFLDSLNGPTKIAFQHSLRILRGEYKCHAAVKAIGILPDGTVVSCSWALDKNSRPLSSFEIGKLPENKLSDIIERAVTEKRYSERCDYCRTIRYLEEES